MAPAPQRDGRVLIHFLLEKRVCFADRRQAFRFAGQAQLFRVIPWPRN